MQSNNSNVFRGTTADFTAPSSTGSSDVATGLVGGYVSLTVLLPVFVFLAVLLLFIVMCLLASITSKLSNISDKLDMLNDNTLRGPISPEAYNRLVQEENQEVATRTILTRQVMLVILGVLSGAMTAVIGSLFAYSEIWQLFFVGLGIMIIIAALVAPFLKKSSHKVNDETDSHSNGTGGSPS